MILAMSGEAGHTGVEAGEGGNTGVAQGEAEWSVLRPVGTIPMGWKHGMLLTEIDGLKREVRSTGDSLAKQIDKLHTTVGIWGFACFVLLLCNWLL
jgi:hypothetical protein